MTVVPLLLLEINLIKEEPSNQAPDLCYWEPTSPACGARNDHLIGVHFHHLADEGNRHGP